MDDYAALMLAVQKAAPDDATPLLIAADWCDDNDKKMMAYALRWCAADGFRPFFRPDVKLEACEGNEVQEASLTVRLVEVTRGEYDEIQED